MKWTLKIIIIFVDFKLCVHACDYEALPLQKSSKIIYERLIFY